MSTKHTAISTHSRFTVGLRAPRRAPLTTISTTPNAAATPISLTRKAEMISIGDRPVAIGVEHDRGRRSRPRPPMKARLAPAARRRPELRQRHARTACASPRRRGSPRPPRAPDRAGDTPARIARPVTREMRAPDRRAAGSPRCRRAPTATPAAACTLNAVASAMANTVPGSAHGSAEQPVDRRPPDDAPSHDEPAGREARARPRPPVLAAAIHREFDQRLAAAPARPASGRSSPG